MGELAGMFRDWVLAGVLAAALCGPAKAAADQAPSPCGATVTVRRGDTLSRIASRCQIGEATLLAANPAVKSSADLQVGGTLATQAGQSGVASSLGALGSSAANLMNGLADRAGSTTQDLLARHPELQTRLRSLGESVGLSGGALPPSVLASPQSGPRGATVTVAATGLGDGQLVSIGAGPPGEAFEIVGHARSSSNGTLAVDVTAPDVDPQADALVFTVIGADGNVLGRSDRFELAP